MDFSFIFVPMLEDVKKDAATILHTIAMEYDTNTMTLADLEGVLINCGYSRAECGVIIREGLNTKEIGRVSFRNVGRNMPSKRTVIYLQRKVKKVNPWD